MIKGILYFGVSITLLTFAYIRKQSHVTLNYLPLGDSYTIGTGASEKDAWPSVLVDHLNQNNIKCHLLVNPARNGFSTLDLINVELPLVKELKPDFVTLLIGANDWVRGVTKKTYTDNLIYILEELQKEMPKNGKILLVTIPDFGVTPYGKNFLKNRNKDPSLSEFNAVIKEQGKLRKISVVDIFEISKKMGIDTSLVSSDGLHPSKKCYALWESIILPEALKLLK